jgi:uroporphyrinogen-III synthase
MIGPLVLTGSLGSFAGLREALEERSIEVLDRPLIDFAPPASWTPLDTALDRLATYPAVAFTSPRAVKAVVDRLASRGLQWPQTSPAVWAGGTSTRAELEKLLGSGRVLQPEESAGLGAAKGLARAMLAAGTSGPVLFACGAQRRDELPAWLRAKGVQVEEVECYRTILAPLANARAAAVPGEWLVVASPSVVGLLVRAYPSAERPYLIAVGPTTAAAARDAGWTPAAVADEPSVAGLIEAINGLLARR